MIGIRIVALNEVSLVLAFRLLLATTALMDFGCSSFKSAASSSFQYRCTHTSTYSRGLRGAQPFWGADMSAKLHKGNACGLNSWNTSSPSALVFIHSMKQQINLTSSASTLDQNSVDVSTPTLARFWRKRFRKSKEEIEAAIAKVGGNAETVMKELGVNA